ncbi:MAG: hypothetical protein K6G12_05175 [Lachnospiraceae bacterium]|nr:hypothetical protein [Lachnospiraceae bacterium]
MEISYIDKLENNLMAKVRLLEKIYECDERLNKVIDVDKSSFEDYDTYIEEKELLLDELDKLDKEADEITKYLENNKTRIDLVPADRRAKIMSLVSEVAGKTEAVRDIESRIRLVTDRFFENRRTDIRNSRRNLKVVQSSYGLRNALATDETSRFDAKN